jgi:branched-subunit amino acid transport protein
MKIEIRTSPVLQVVVSAIISGVIATGILGTFGMLFGGYSLLWLLAAIPGCLLLFVTAALTYLNFICGILAKAEREE